MYYVKLYVKLGGDITPKNICNFSDCHRIIPGNKKYCPEHEKEMERFKQEKNRRYDTKIRYKRDKRYTEFYHSKEWEILRDYIIKKYKGLDVFAYCIENRIVPATTGHHIIGLKEDYSKGLVIDNIIPVSDESHRKIHAMYNRNRKGTQKMLKELLQNAGFNN